MSLPRFFAPDLDPAAEEATLPPDEARHLTRVLRLGEGDDISVFDGRGVEFLARVARASREVVVVTLIGSGTPAPESRVPLTLAQAVLKGDKMDGVVRDATMLGAAAIVPLVTARTVIPARAARSGVERWQRVAIASAKQSGRAVVPVISAPQTFDDWLELDSCTTRILLVEPSVSRRLASLRDVRELGTPRTASVTVGPEGGWSPAEITKAATAAYALLTISRRTLRADAVGLAALSILQYVWDLD